MVPPAGSVHPGGDVTGRVAVGLEQPLGQIDDLGHVGHRLDRLQAHEFADVRDPLEICTARIAGREVLLHGRAFTLGESRLAQEVLPREVAGRRRLLYVAEGDRPEPALQGLPIG